MVSISSTFARDCQKAKNYIVDFYIASAKIVIEIDGIQHQFPENKKKDDIRDKYLNDLGIKVMRFNNLMINDNFGYM